MTLSVSHLNFTCDPKVSDLSPSDLVKVISGLATIRSGLLDDGGDGVPDLPEALMEEGGRLLARAIARQNLTAHEIVQVGSWSEIGSIRQQSVYMIHANIHCPQYY